MSNLMNLVISSDEASEFMQDGLAYNYMYIHNMDINEATKRVVKENRPALVRYPHSAPSDIIIKKVFS